MQNHPLPSANCQNNVEILKKKIMQLAYQNFWVRNPNQAKIIHKILVVNFKFYYK